MLRSKTACHAAIWHGEIRLDEIHLKAQDVQWLANSSIQSAIYKHQARGGMWYAYRMILLALFEEYLSFYQVEIGIQ